MKKKFTVIMLVFLLSLSVVFAHDHNFDEAEQLVNSKIDCELLDDEQLELIGEYFMERMHPGESHTKMDNMMGGEGSESLKQMHIRMAKSMYCNEGEMMNGGMMNMMMGNNMMGGNMMNMMGGGMMGNSWWLQGFIGLLFYIALLTGLVLLIIWLYQRITGNNSALNTLNKRFAKGEINKKQFSEMKKLLKKG